MEIYKSNPPTLTQIGSLSEMMQKDGYVKDNFNLTDCWDNLRQAVRSEKYYKFLIAIILNNDTEKIDETMPKLGFNKKF